MHQINSIYNDVRYLISKLVLWVYRNKMLYFIFNFTKKNLEILDADNNDPTIPQMTRYLISLVNYL